MCQINPEKDLVGNRIRRNASLARILGQFEGLIVTYPQTFQLNEGAASIQIGAQDEGIANAINNVFTLRNTRTFLDEQIKLNRFVLKYYFLSPLPRRVFINYNNIVRDLEMGRY